MASLSSFPISSTLHPPSPHVQADGANRQSPFHPTVWGDYFLAIKEDQKKIDAWSRKVEELKEKVKRMLSIAKGTIEEMMLIDKLQLLGVAYHFEIEIKEALKRIYNSKVDYNNLHTVALRFRLLREDGYYASSDVFNKFKDDKAKFKESLTSDVKGMLSLYEAAFYGIRGEDILDEAISFTSEHLSSLVAHLANPLASQVRHALELPMRKRMQRLEARFYISVFQEENEKDVLLEFAKLDFNVLQSIHRKEIQKLTRWWKDLGLSTKYPFARDRLVEGYFWVLGVYHEPQYARARCFFVRVLKMLSIMDDIYDVNGKLEELEVLTDALERWDIKATDQLPEYMKPCYLAILNTVDEIEDELMPGEKFYRTDSLKYAVKVMSRGWIKEAQWLNHDYVPTLEEYLEASLVTAGYLCLVGTSYTGLGEEATTEVFDWLRTHPKFILDSCIIARLLDDIQSNEFEQKREHVASAVECYGKEHGVSKKEACDKLREMVAIAWKDINEFCIKQTILPFSLIVRVVNLTRALEIIYQHGDGYTDSSHETKEKITAVVVNPIPM